MATYTVGPRKRCLHLRLSLSSKVYKKKRGGGRRREGGGEEGRGGKAKETREVMLICTSGVTVVFCTVASRACGV